MQVLDLTNSLLCCNTKTICSYLLAAKLCLCAQLVMNVWKCRGGGAGQLGRADQQEVVTLTGTVEPSATGIKIFD